MKIEITIDTQKNKALKKVLKDKTLEFELQKLADRYMDDMILTYFRGTKSMTDALNDLET